MPSYGRILEFGYVALSLLISGYPYLEDWYDMFSEMLVNLYVYTGS